jgi:uncharacterized protein RhaS with RHS repeats
MDEATGLMYYRARWYDPQQARFISEDPIGGMNRYAYTGNNPISRIDPMGTSWSTFVDGLMDRFGNEWTKGRPAHLTRLLTGMFN